MGGLLGPFRRRQDRASPRNTIPALRPPGHIRIIDPFMEPAPRFPTVVALRGVPFLREDRLVTQSVVISGTGLWTPEQSITNEELVASFNEYVARYNERHATAIEAGEMEALTGSNSAFLAKASVLKQPYVLER